MERRLRAGAVERQAAEDLPYHYVINDDIDRAALEIAELIAAHRRRIGGSSTPSC